MTFNGITKGAEIIIRKAERPYRCAGFVDPSTTIPSTEERATVLKITRTKRGRKVHVLGELCGFAIMLDDLPEFMTVEAI